MKLIARSITFNSLALFFISQIFAGVKITGGIQTFLLGAGVLTIMSLVLKPIINILSLPFNLITFGFFSILTNTLILYLLTVFVSTIQITAFTFPGFSFFGFVIPKMEINTFFAFILVSFTGSGILSFFKWLTS